MGETGRNLHAAKSLEELQKMSSLRLLPKTATVCVSRLHDIQKAIRTHRNNGDQELEYIQLYKFITLVTKLKKLPNYESVGSAANGEIQELAKNNMNRLEELSHILKQRYNRAKASLKEVPSNNKVSSLPTPPQEPPRLEKSISCSRFFKMFSDLQPDGNSLLLLDARSRADFKESHLKPKPGMRLINVPEEIIGKGLSAAKLGTLMSEEESEVWKIRKKFKSLILFDWNQSEKTLKTDCALARLREIIVEWDPGEEYKSPPIILDGGYEDIISRYPHLTTNPKATLPAKEEPSIILESLEYPIHVLEPKKEDPPPPPKEVVLPKKEIVEQVSFDRSKKPKLLPSEKKEIPAREGGGDTSRSSPPDQVVPISPSSPGPSVEPVEPKRPQPVIPEKPREIPPTGQAEHSYKMSALDDSDTQNVKRPGATMMKKLPHDLDAEDKRSVLEALRRSKPQNILAGTTNSVKTNSIIKPVTEQPHDEEVYTTPLKKDGSSASNLKRSSSSPNIAQDSALNGDNKISEEESTPKHPPFSRATKPRPMNNFMFDECSDSIHGKTEAAGLTGLKNFANNCYMNSIVQCLSNTKELNEDLISLQNNNQLTQNPMSKTKGRVAREIINTLRRLWSGEYRVVNIKELKAVMGEIKDIFKGNSHQDSNEFLIILLEYLHEDLNDVNRNEVILAGADESSGEKAWGEFKRKNNSVIQRLFYGQQKSTVTCGTCHHSSVTFEPFFNLFVPIPSDSDTPTLDECIQLYMSGERISGWICPKCKVGRNATKKFDISKLPPILIIALKRFTQEDDSWLHKKETVVSYPLNNLNMEKFTVRNSEQRFSNYNLYAISTHSGTLRAGHYRAVCKNFITNKWYVFDDSSVDPLAEHRVRNIPEAYILFYSYAKPD